MKKFSPAQVSGRGVNAFEDRASNTSTPSEKKVKVQENTVQGIKRKTTGPDDLLFSPAETYSSKSS